MHVLVRALQAVDECIERSGYLPHVSDCVVQRIGLVPGFHLHGIVDLVVHRRFAELSGEGHGLGPAVHIEDALSLLGVDPQLSVHEGARWGIVGRGSQACSRLWSRHSAGRGGWGIRAHRAIKVNIPHVGVGSNVPSPHLGIHDWRESIHDWRRQPFWVVPKRVMGHSVYRFISACGGADRDICTVSGRTETGRGGKPKWVALPS